MKKPLYKKWWFWLIVVILIGVVGSQLGNDDKDTQKETEKVITKEYYEIGEIVETDKYSFVVNSIRELEPNQFVQPKEGKIIFLCRCNIFKQN
ncbi:hypothetical protein MGH68_07070 [Erysipelothrix sp. D19-032]